MNIFEKVRNFDHLVLTPLSWTANLAAVGFLILRLWPWLIGSVLASCYISIIAAKMHRELLFSDLAHNAGAEREEASLTPIEHRLVGHACTRVGILLGVILALVVWSISWRWYSACLIGFMAMLLSDAVLKLLFKTV